MLRTELILKLISLLVVAFVLRIIKLLQKPKNCRRFITHCDKTHFFCFSDCSLKGLGQFPAACLKFRAKLS